MRKSKPKKGTKVTLWEAIRDVLIASLNKGQFPLALLAGVILMFLWKMPSEDVSKLAFLIYSGFVNGYLVGYGIAFAIIPAWFFHAKWQRQTIDHEMRRITDERNKLQESRLGAKLTSSDVRK